jgi:uncharacterized membrane protein
MKKIVLTFGLIAGLIVSATLLVMLQMHRDGRPPENGELIGYSSMLIAFVLIYVGIRSERERSGGRISFGRAFKTGILITLVASAVYVVTWEIYYYNFDPGFMERYAESAIEKSRAGGATEFEIAAERRRMENFARLYRNPLVNVGFTLLEIVPVGLLVTLVSAAILKTKQQGADPRLAS